MHLTTRYERHEGEKRRQLGNKALVEGASGLSEHVGATADRVIVVTYGVIDADACIEARASSVIGLHRPD
jgi:hypothetical protein